MPGSTCDRRRLRERGDLRGRDLLHRRRPRPGPHQVFAGLLCEPRQGTREARGSDARHQRPRHQRHGRPLQALCRGQARGCAPRRDRHPDPFPHPRHGRLAAGHAPRGRPPRGERGRRRLRSLRRAHEPAELERPGGRRPPHAIWPTTGRLSATTTPPSSAE